MSEEIKTTDDSHNEKITSVVKTKDPRRVEAGKRLGMISKQAKEKKLAQMRDLQDEISAKQSKASISETSDWFSNTLVSSPVVSIGFVGLVGLVLYYGYNKKYKTLVLDDKDSPEPQVNPGTQNSNPEPQVNPKPKRAYKELDTLD